MQMKTFELQGWAKYYEYVAHETQKQMRKSQQRGRR